LYAGRQTPNSPKSVGKRSRIFDLLVVYLSKHVSLSSQGDASDFGFLEEGKRQGWVETREKRDNAVSYV